MFQAQYEPGGAALLILLPLYFLPTIIAAVRKVPNVGSVIVVNFFLGWTLIGWIIALAMAAGSTQPRVVVNASATSGSMPASTSASPTFTHSGTRYLFGYVMDPSGYAIWDRLAPGPPFARFPYSEHGKAEGLARYEALEGKVDPPSLPAAP